MTVTAPFPIMGGAVVCCSLAKFVSDSLPSRGVQHARAPQSFTISLSFLKFISNELEGDAM